VIPLTEDELDIITAKSRQCGHTFVFLRQVIFRVEHGYWPKVESELIDLVVEDLDADKQKLINDHFTDLL
jgi:hypothetical protein